MNGLRFSRDVAAKVVAGVLVLAFVLTGCGSQGVYSLPLPGGADTGKNPYTIAVEFTDVLDLVPRSAVKVGDVAVGQVTKVELVGWHAKVYCQVKRSVRLPDNAVASIQQTSLLGEKYVELGQPTTETPHGRLGDGDVIPLPRTGKGAEVEEVLSALALLLNGGGLPQLQTINKELNQALGGREDKVRDVISRLDTFIGGLDRQKASIDKAITNLDALAAQLRKQRTTINETLDKVPPALKVLTEQRRDLVKLLRELAKLGKVGTRVINETKADLVANLRALEPILDKLADAGADLPNALGVMLTYPFPTDAANGIKGDYTNLHLTADINLLQVLQVVGKGGPQTGRQPQLDELLKLLRPDVLNGRQGPSPGRLLPSGLVPTSGSGGGGGKVTARPTSTPSPSGGTGGSGGGSGGSDGGLVGLLLGGLG
ncbi:MAG: MCE family protein [Streptosporangiales bacterium]|nr:MCE family protein [Streptosporangiales bacterium]MBO0891917.1 MCE family protein [Acidothermales bacterium]